MLVMLAFNQREIIRAHRRKPYCDIKLVLPIETNNGFLMARAIILQAATVCIEELLREEFELFRRKDRRWIFCHFLFPENVGSVAQMDQLGGSLRFPLRPQRRRLRYV